jgi:Flp pilus assembly protein TadG
MFGFGRRKAADSRRSGGFLSRLARDSRGNTLAIVGAALIPLTAMIGSGVDMSRAYMAKTRLQVACDAAALAARRVMANDTLTTAVTTEGTRFFNYNFNQGLYGTAAFTPTITRPASGTIRVAASTTIPTTIMRMFGFTTLPLNVTCDAQLNFVNTDVMLVLDTTGSMNNDVNDNSTSIDANRKITALRAAVLALYDQLKPTQDQLEANGLRLRYGVVPYSSSVNVGSLIRAVDPTYLRDSVPYQTRTADYGTYGTTTNSDTTVTETYGSSITQTECNSYAANAGYPTLNGQPANTGGPNPAPVTHITYSLRDWGGSGTADTSGTTRTCRRYKRTLVDQTGYTSSGWTYRQATLDTSQYKLGNAVTIATDDDGVMGSSDSQANLGEIASLANGATTTSATWNGCIEERDTTSTITGSSSNTIPNNAWDLDINRIPNNDGSRWRPMWPDILYTRSAGSTSSTSGNAITGSGSAYYACPSAAVRMQAWTRANLQTYVNGLTPLGGTYHDIGMIWGARLLSPDGIFSADNPNQFGSMPVSRYIIFMTDGNLAPNCNTYTSYGVEQNDMRVTGSSSCTDQLNRHMARFKMVCNAARGMGVSLWVIAFGTTLTQDMIDCASNPNQASTAADSATLIARFQQIGANIGALRLTQ